MKIPAKGITCLVGCLCLMIACTQEPQEVSEPLEMPKPSAAFLKGKKPAPIKAKYINPDSIVPPIVVPLKGKPKVVNAHSNVHPIGTPTINKIPKNLTVFTLGENGVPLPITIPANVKTIPALQPKPITALAPRYSASAIYNIQFLTDDQGLANPFVTAMLEDSRGHLWFGTSATNQAAYFSEGGIYRYDGQNFFHYAAKEGFWIKTVNSLMEDSKGNIWFSGIGGVGYYNGQQFTYFTNEKGFTGDINSALIEDSKGNIWFGNSNGVYNYDGEKLTVFKEEHGLINNYTPDQNLGLQFRINAIMEDMQGDFWWATQGSGVMKYDGQKITHFTEKEGLIHNYISTILEDSKGNIWFGSGGKGVTGRGVSRYNPNSINSLERSNGSFINFTTKEGLSGNQITDMLEDKTGNIWFATFANGVTRYNGQNFTHFTTEEGLNFNGVSCIIEDRKKNIWIGTRNGVSRFQPFSFTHFTEKQGLNKNSVDYLVEDSKGNIWMGTSDDGVIKYDGESFTYLTEAEGLVDNHVTCIMEDSRGTMWFSTRDKGVSNFDGENFTNYSMDQGLSLNYIWDMKEDHKGHIWFACGFVGGITRLNLDNWKFTHFIGKRKHGIGGSNTMEDSQKNLWFGGIGRIAKYDLENDQISFFAQVDTLNYNWVNSLLEDKEGNLWFTSQSDFSLFKRKGTIIENKFTQYGKNIGLSNFTIMSVLEDKQKNVWISSNDGLTVLSGGIEKLTLTDTKWSNYDKFDGLKNKQFQPNSAYLDSKNRMWWGSRSSGVTMLDLNTFQIPTEAPKNLSLSHIEINQQFLDYRNLSNSDYTKTLAFGAKINESVDSVAAFHNYPSTLSLPYDLNHLTFHFSAIDWNAPHKILYSYKMEGLDDDWSKFQTKTEADYRNLSYGTFTFKVKATGEAQVWSEPIAYTFTINPPWWHTWWAYGLYVLLAVGSVSAYVLRLRQKIKQKEKQLEWEQYLNRELRELNIATTRFVPRDFVQILNKEKLKELQLGDQVKANMTVLFADIRDYTGLSEKMTPEQNFKFINAYLGRMGPIIQEHGGFICQYYGDGIMALFKDKHEMAVKAAIEMQQALQRYNRKRFTRNRQPIQIGIGMNTGQLMLGVIGDEQRYDTGVISDAVNTASRMEGLTKIFGCQVIVSETTLMEMNISTETEGKDTLGGDYRFLGKVKVKGKEQILKIYDFYDGQADDIRRLKSETKAYFEKALQLYYEREFGKAADLFKVILEQYPGDIAAKYYMDKSVTYILGNVEENWSGVEDMVSK